MMVSLLPYLLSYGIAAMLPVSPQEAGLIPLTDPIAIYPLVGIHNNGGKDKQNPQIAVVNDETVAVAWQDDTAGIGAGWILISPQGKPLTQEVQGVLKTNGKKAPLREITNPHLCPMPKGEGFLFGVTCSDGSGIVNSDKAIFNQTPKREDAFPYLQRVRADGSFLGNGFSAFPESFLKRKGSVRLADIGYLSNGNILALAEDLQESDGPEIFGLPDTKRTVVASLLSPEGEFLRGPVCVQTSNYTQEAKGGCCGLGIGEGKFSILYETNEIQIRFFDNNLNPLTPEMKADRFNGFLRYRNPEAQVNWCSNGKDRYLMVISDNRQIYAAVYNSQGDDSGLYCLDPQGFCVNRGDGVMDTTGSFLAVWEYSPIDLFDDPGHSGIVIRRFDAQCNPTSPICYVSSIPPEDWVVNDKDPRIAQHGDLLAVAWLDRNLNLHDFPEVMVRMFRIQR